MTSTERKLKLLHEKELAPNLANPLYYPDKIKTGSHLGTGHFVKKGKPHLP
jgi:hypothetical protein